eukprot:TRINITY_DN4132_c0_g1_i2.p1 TRINITY_DN4132_c0_g1~~TRINITY_DN4132_c0_g1_i2.p1  ORF type:complete len:806 (-),score=155.83 TRINITY_DN4132_c0_g1_i2:260-2677(-)
MADPELHSDENEFWPSSADDYQLNKKIGYGVWRANRKEKESVCSEKLVIIKIIPFDPTSPKGVKVESILKNFQKCQHENITKCLHYFVNGKELWVIEDASTWQGTIRLTTELLAKRFPNGLPEHLVGAILRQVISVVIFMHNAGLVWHDLRPKNFLLRSDGKIIVNTISLRSVLQEKTRDSLPFLAPELLQNTGTINFDTSFKADIWSLGISAYELATGVLPFGTNETAPSQLTTLIIESDPPPFREEWSKEFRDLLQKCFVKDPELRISTQQLVEHPFIRNAPGPEVIASSSFFIREERPETTNPPTNQPNPPTVSVTIEPTSLLLPTATATTATTNTNQPVVIIENQMGSPINPPINQVSTPIESSHNDQHTEAPSSLIQQGNTAPIGATNVVEQGGHLNISLSKSSHSSPTKTNSNNPTSNQTTTKISNASSNNAASVAFNLNATGSHPPPNNTNNATKQNNAFPVPAVTLPTAVIVPTVLIPSVPTIPVIEATLPVLAPVIVPTMPIPIHPPVVVQNLQQLETDKATDTNEEHHHNTNTTGEQVQSHDLESESSEDGDDPKIEGESDASETDDSLPATFPKEMVKSKSFPVPKKTTKSPTTIRASQSNRVGSSKLKVSNRMGHFMSTQELQEEKQRFIEPSPRFDGIVEDSHTSISDLDSRFKEIDDSEVAEYVMLDETQHHHPNPHNNDLFNVPIETYLGESPDEFVVFLRTLPSTTVHLRLESRALVITGAFPPLLTPGIEQDPDFTLLHDVNHNFEKRIRFSADIDPSAADKLLDKAASMMTIRVKKFKPRDFGNETF